MALLQAEHGEQFFFIVFLQFNLLHVYTSPNHGSSVLRHRPVTHVTQSHLLTHLTHDPLTALLLQPVVRLSTPSTPVVLLWRHSGVPCILPKLDLGTPLHCYGNRIPSRSRSYMNHLHQHLLWWQNWAQCLLWTPNSSARATCRTGLTIRLAMLKS